MIENNPQESQLARAIKALEIDEARNSSSVSLTDASKKYWQWFSFSSMFVVLVGLEILFYFLSLINSLNEFVLNILLPLILLLQIASFIILSVKFLVKREIKKSFLKPTTFALAVGLGVAIFKVLFYFKTWTVYNIILEPLTLVVWAVFSALVCNVFFRIYEIFNFNKDKVKSSLNF